MHHQKRVTTARKSLIRQSTDEAPCNKIYLPSINKISSETNMLIYTKIQNLINDDVYKKIFPDNQLEEVLKYLYANKNSDNPECSQYRSSRSCIIKESKDLKILSGNRSFYANNVRKRISQDIQNSSRYEESKNSVSKSTFTIAPKKLYQHHLLYKYCILKKDIYLPPINLDCSEFLKNTEFNPSLLAATPVYSNPLYMVDCAKYNLPSLSFLTINYTKTPSIHSVSNTTNQPLDINFRTGSTDFKQTNKESIRKEFEPILTKALQEGYTQPRLSKENIQELIRQSLTNVANKTRESISIREIRKNQRRRSTLSESQHFTESGDFLLSSIDASDASKDDIVINESVITKMAINGTKEYIKSTEEIEDITWSGTKFGKHDFTFNIGHNSKYEGNYGYIDGINLTYNVFKKYSISHRNKFANETFSALSHMYSLKKLLDRKSLIINQEPKVSIQNKSYSSPKEYPESDRGILHTESSETTIIDSIQSVDYKLLKMFRNKFHK